MSHWHPRRDLPPGDRGFRVEEVGGLLTFVEDDDDLLQKRLDALARRARRDREASEFALSFEAQPAIVLDGDGRRCLWNGRTLTPMDPRERGG